MGLPKQRLQMNVVRQGSVIEAVRDGARGKDKLREIETERERGRERERERERANERARHTRRKRDREIVRQKTRA